MDETKEFETIETDVSNDSKKGWRAKALSTCIACLLIAFVIGMIVGFVLGFNAAAAATHSFRFILK